MSRCVAIVIFLILSLGLTQSACTQSLQFPNIPTKVTKYDDGSDGLIGWEAAPREGAVNRIIPEDASFKGAVSWVTAIDEKNPKKALEKALMAEGVRSLKILSIKETDKTILQKLDPNPKASAHTIMAAGKLDGRPARVIAFAFYGNFGMPANTPPSSGMHMFLAPKPAFEALGGMAIPGVRWLGGTTGVDEDMSEDGQLSPDEATEKLALFFDSWAINYVTNDMMFNMMMGQTMATHQQTINTMQSYNNALSACGGAGDCMSQGADGTWSADLTYADD